MNLNITFTNAAGQPVASESPSIDLALPGTQSAITGSTKATGVTGMTVQANVDKWQQNERPITGAFTTSGVSTTTDTYGSTKTVGVVRSTFDKDYKDLHAYAVYESAAGQVLGGSDTWLDFVPANGQSSLSIDDLEGHPAGTAKSVVYVEFSNISTLGS